MELALMFLLLTLSKYSLIAKLIKIMLKAK